MKRNHIKMCLWGQADSGRPSCTLARGPHCSGTILERLGWSWCSKNPATKYWNNPPVTVWKSRLKPTGGLFCFIYHIGFTCWCSWGQRRWAAAAPAFPEDEGLCLRRDEEDSNEELMLHVFCFRTARISYRILLLTHHKLTVNVFTQI